MAIDVIFSGVVAYHFEGDALQNIVFDVEEVPFGYVIDDDTTLVERNKRSGSPGGWDPRRESAEQFFSRVGCRMFALSCSYGMEGWVAAERMEWIVREPK